MTTTPQRTTWPDDAMTADDAKYHRQAAAWPNGWQSQATAQRLNPPRPATNHIALHQPAKRAPRAVQTIARTIIMVAAAAVLIGAAWLCIVLMVAAFG